MEGLGSTGSAHLVLLLAMNSAMLGRRNDLEVGCPVIHLVAVNVMDLAIGKDFAADLLLGDSSMRQRPLPCLWIFELGIAASVDPCLKSPGLPGWSLGRHV